jgi:low affinity Fe/Cu permease
VHARRSEPALGADRESARRAVRRSSGLAGFSNTWQLVINTGTTILTFNMVFVIQNTQNRDGLAVQVKLDAILHALDRADDELMGIEDLTEKEIHQHQEHVREQAEPDSSTP